MTPEEMKRFFGQNNLRKKIVKKQMGEKETAAELELFKRLIPKSK